MDGVGELVSKDFERLCDQDGIAHEVVPLYTASKLCCRKKELFDHEHGEKHVKWEELS